MLPAILSEINDQFSTKILDFYATLPLSSARMDVSFHVVKELKKHPYNGPPIHSVAVDEVQDLAQSLGGWQRYAMLTS